ncbi:zf-HC2 domain-containing protein [Brachybacterium sp. GPGPB12]|uniref:zf-HC2 domain-containing protein n=1 Tax=Brachybacterium sp. GPGPB12 TaxID=3023517 RepID=UPI00313445F1
MTQDDRAMRETSTRETATGSTRDMSFGLEEALDGELPRETVERMRRHTDDCPECADEWERLRRLKELVRRRLRGPRPLRPAGPHRRHVPHHHGDRHQHEHDHRG